MIRLHDPTCRPRRALALALALAAWSPAGRAGAADRPQEAGPTALATVARGALLVTSGEVRGAGTDLEVEVAQVRAVVPGSSGEDAELRFVLQGITAGTARLASGEVRRQLGLKLRAADACNLVYVMWRPGETPAIAVSVKLNPGQVRSAECGAGGYHPVRASWFAEPPALRIGEPRTLRATIRDGRLEVQVDGARVWTGLLPGGAEALHGPAGLRIDNLRLSAQLRSAP